MPYKRGHSVNYIAKVMQKILALSSFKHNACRTPVIAYYKGGARETIKGLDQENPTGLFFTEQTTDAICAAVAIFERNATKFTAATYRENALQFSQANFHKHFIRYVLGRYTAA